MNPRGERRMRKWDKLGRQPVCPMTRCTLAALPTSSYSGGELSKHDEAELKRIDSKFRVVYDVCTTNGFGPGHHLYREVDMQDGSPVLQLEFSLQWDIDMKWPEGRPRAPGPWLIEEVKKRLRTCSVDEQIENMIEKSEAADRAAAKEFDQENMDRAKDLAPWAKAAMEGGEYHGRRVRLNASRPRGKKAYGYRGKVKAE